MTDRGPVVIAADDDDIRELVVVKLEQSGYEVVAVSDGSAALAAVRERCRQLAILDVMMPGDVRARRAARDSCRPDP